MHVTAHFESVPEGVLVMSKASEIFTYEARLDYMLEANLRIKTILFHADVIFLVQLKCTQNM